MLASDARNSDFLLDGVASEGKYNQPVSRLISV